MILIRLTTDGAIRLGAVITSRSRPSIRYRIRRPSRWGSRWMSLARSRVASASTWFTSRTTGASSSETDDEPRAAAGSSRTGRGVLDDLLDERDLAGLAGQRPGAGDLLADLRRRGDHDHDLVAARVEAHVVQGQHVGGVAARDDERAVGVPVQRDRAGAVDDVLRQQPDDVRRGDDARQVDVLEAEVLGQALGHLHLAGVAEQREHLAEALAAVLRLALQLQGLAQLLGGDDPLGEQDLAHPASARTGRPPRHAGAGRAGCRCSTSAGRRSCSLIGRRGPPVLT